MPNPEIVLGPNQYGKAQVRVVRVNCDTEVHTLQDLSVTSLLRGNFDATFLTGDNTGVIATDTQKNTVYAFAKEKGIASPEEFLLELGRHFTLQPQVSGGRWEAEAFAWERIQVPVTGRSAGSVGTNTATETVAHDHSFVKNKDNVRTAALTIENGIEYLLGGFKDLTLLKSTGSEFHGYPKDNYTTLPETTDRIMATDITARWLFCPSPDTRADVDFDGIYDRVKQIVMEQFAVVHSLSLQQTLYAAGEAVLEEIEEIEDIRFVMPNNHHYLVDLQRFGVENHNEVFEAGVLPYGYMNASVTRADAKPQPHA